MAEIILFERETTVLNDGLKLYRVHELYNRVDELPVDERQLWCPYTISMYDNISNVIIFTWFPRQPLIQPLLNIMARGFVTSYKCTKRTINCL